MSKVITGIEFNKLYPTTVFIKLTNETENHNNFQFTTGLNIDTVKFDTTKDCQAGGIYFCKQDQFYLWKEYNTTKCVYMRQVKIPNDAKVFIEGDKYKASKLILAERQTILDDEKICMLAIDQNCNPLKYMDKQSDAICKYAVAKNGYMLKDVHKQTDEICKIAVAQTGHALQYVNKQTVDICKIAIKQNPNSFLYVKNKRDELCKLVAGKKLMCIRILK
jgi:hypothetical protein